MRRRCIGAVSAALALLAWAVASGSSAGASPPKTISPPGGLNLGSTSFFDGFGRESEGWSILQYERFEDLNTITGPTGQPVPYFKGTRIEVGVALTQLAYTTDWRPFGGHFAFSAALPVVDFVRSSFSSDSPVKLANNGLGIGDLVWGPIYQSKVYTKRGRPSFVWRAQLIILSPTGEVNRTKDMNQGAGYWGINPYVAFSYLPTSKIEISNRLNYQYNFVSNAFSNPPPIPGFVYRNGQGGQLVYDNFAVSYAVTSHLNLGAAGYVLDQLTLDRTNGAAVASSRENELYLGPGARIKINENNYLNLNAYFKIIANNAVAGPQFNTQLIHRF